MSMENKIPQLYGAIVLIFPCAHLSPQVSGALPANIEIVEYSNFVEAVYCELDNVCSWEIDDLLSQLFINCDLNLLCDFISIHNARVLIDISFHHYEKFPALVFEGRNMQIIHMLQADISIDPY